VHALPLATRPNKSLWLATNCMEQELALVFFLFLAYKIKRVTD